MEQRRMGAIEANASFVVAIPAFPSHLLLGFYLLC
jgi:hypothetical protein